MLGGTVTGTIGGGGVGAVNAGEGESVLPLSEIIMFKLR